MGILSPPLPETPWGGGSFKGNTDVIFEISTIEIPQN